MAPRSSVSLRASPSALRARLALRAFFLLLLSSLALAEQPLLTGPTELLDRFDIGPTQLETFVSGQPLSATEQDVLAKILYHFHRLGLDNLQRWREARVTWDQ